MLKMDFHCHCSEGSTDSRVKIKDYISLLKRQGFQGMLCTDHDSYNSYLYWKQHLKSKEDDFIVLKGIEYDTFEAGHMLIILPENVNLPALEYQGMSIFKLIPLVHAHGGILGPAHPFGERFLCFAHTRCGRKHPELYHSFDFVETFNSCEYMPSNLLARHLARVYHKAEFGGSDAHHLDCVGKGYTLIPDYIRTESDLIDYIKGGGKTESGGILFDRTLKQRIGVFNKVLVYGFWPYNKVRSAACYRKRIKVQYKG